MILLLLVLFALQFGKTQLFVVEKILDSLEEKYDVSFHVEAIKINPFGGFRIHNFLIEDHHQDTLIYVQDLKGRVVNLQDLKNKKLSFKNISVKNGVLNDFSYPDEEISSLSVFTHKFATDKRSAQPLVLSFTNVYPENLRYVRHTPTRKIVDFNQVSGRIQQLTIEGPNVEVETDSLSFKDIYEIDYKKLATNFKYTLSKMSFEKTQIKTSHSNLFCDVIFDYQISDFSDFVQKVKIDGSFEKSEISLEDINKIYPYIDGKEVFDIKSKVSGTLNDLFLKNTELISLDNTTYLLGDFRLKNSIQDRENFWFQVNNANIEMIPNRLTNLIPNQYHKNLPKDYYGLKQFNYIGDFFVSRSKLVMKGEVVSNLGKVQLNGFLEDLDTDQKKIDVEILQGFIPKNVLHQDLKKILFKGDAVGIIDLNHLDLLTHVDFQEIGYKNNTIRNSSLKLKLRKDAIQSNFQSRDSLMSFVANADYHKKGNDKEYDLDFEIKKLKLAKLFPGKVTYQKNIIASGTANLIENKDSLVSYGIIKKLQIDTELESLNLNEVDLYLLSKEKEKKIELKSKDLLNLGIYGDFEFSDLEKLVENALYKFIPGRKTRADVKDQTLNFDLKVFPKFAKSITDKIELNDNLVVSGVLDAQGDKGVIRASLPAFSSQDFEVDSLKIVLDNSNQWINSNISIDRFRFKKQVYEDLSLLGKKVNDTLFVRSDFSSDKINNRAVFYLTTGEDNISLGIENVYFKYLNSTWVNREERENKVYYNYKTGQWYFYGISFVNNKQEFDFDGSIEKDKSKNLRLELKNINLAEVLPGIDSLKVGGIASGKVFFNENNNLLKPNGNLFVDKLKINGVDYGSMATSLKPNDKKLGYDINFKIYNATLQNIDAKGEITIDKTDFLASKIDLKVVLNNLKLNSLSPLGRDVLSSIRGSAQGDLTVTGQLNDFNSYGFINLKNAGLKFPYLNTDYNFIGNTRVDVDGKSFVFNKVSLQDNVYKTEGVLTGKINYDKFNNWYLDLKVDTQNLLVLNTEQQENSRYYGTGFMKGNASIKGYTSGLSINVTGTTLPNTTFILPLSDVKQIEKNKFIHYKEQTTSAEDEYEEVDVSNEEGLNVTLNIEVTKDAFGEIVIDQNSGSSLQARADGRLLLDIDKFSNIKMYGDLVLNEGMYIYKYGKIINKPFIVKKGGTVSWSGDPFKAELNIEALHSVKANPKVLLESLSINRKIDVDLITKVTGELMDSNQEFIIEIPNASSTVASELDFKLNIDENSKMRQFFSLLVSKTFFDENKVNSTSSVLSNTTSELISNAVTEIFNNGDNKVQVNFGYTAGENSDIEDLTVDDQIDIGLETEINDRILINGKLGVPVGTKTQSAVVGEVKVEFLLNKEGTLRSSVFNRQNEIQYSEEEQGYTQGVGLNYQIDFNNLKEMLEKIGLRRKRKKKEGKGEISQEIEDNLIYVLPTLP
ncbi:translocation/assembly module TamB domain-containing protein [Wenyingzhuangia sp. 2_MG-2023]|uniref:translocation/assembly module TamB domain-containing protein n=1 Tax=Wenyingzhuangia sp. 2_MG-2023 TaxID=3062639 RepID=UPI0026E47766|nr:translocation/assembly module TamB domain-containing protein [Wenyingzhuangia sp. 2_MG-2023]MDO6737887.1 translocation/assembly module TamB domain-containing protein [Wenyingzhuangia sp. 2_MG-2023]